VTLLSYNNGTYLQLENVTNPRMDHIYMQLQQCSTLASEGQVPCETYGKVNIQLHMFSGLPPDWHKNAQIPNSQLYEYEVGKQSKGKAIPLQAWTGPEGSRSFSGVPDF